MIIAGIIQDQEYFDQQIKPRLDDTITFDGHAGPEARNTILKGALALLHPINFDEPFGLSVAEAMYCGTPVIAFNRGSMSEVIKHRHSGYLVQNIGEAVEAVGSVSSINRIDCHHWARDNFSSEKMVADYMSLYKQIVQR